MGKVNVHPEQVFLRVGWNEEGRKQAQNPPQEQETQAKGNAASPGHPGLSP